MGVISATIQSAGAVAAAGINAAAATDAARISADAAKYQADKQLQANKEQQEFEKEQAELAFQRNSTKGQLQQLIDAGISEQQARTILASQGTSGEYSPAASVNPMQGVDYTAAANAQAQGLQQAGQSWAQGTQQSLNAFGNAADQYGTLLLKAFASKDGDALGNFASNGALEFFTKNVKDVDRSKVQTFIDLENWIDSLDPKSDVGKKWKDWTSSKEFNELKEFSPAVKAFNSNIQSIYTTNLESSSQLRLTAAKTQHEFASKILTDAQTTYCNSQNAYMQELILTAPEERNLIIQKRKTEVQNTNLVYEQVLGEHYESLCSKLNYNRLDATVELLTDVDKARLMNELNIAIVESQFSGSAGFSRAYSDLLANKLDSENDKAIYESFHYMLEACKEQKTYNKFCESPSFSWIVSIYNALHSSGLTEDVSNILGRASQGASGAGVLLKAIKAVPK